MGHIKTRIPQYDLIRGIAIFFVFCIHSLGVANEEYAAGGFTVVGNVLYNAFSTLVGTAVPLFVMLSGALLLGGAGDVEHFLKKRLKRVLVPFFWWSVILFGLSVFKEHENISVMLVPQFLSKFLTYGVHGVYWYVYLIIGLYLIAPLLRPFFRNANQRDLVYVFVVCVLYVIVSSIFPEVRWVKGFHADYFVYVAYFACGYIIAHFLKNADGMKVISIVVCVSTLIVGTLNAMYRFTSFPMGFFLSISLFCMLLYVPISETKPLVFISNASYGMYLSHVVFISLLLKMGFARVVPLWVEPLSMALVVMLIECALMIMIKKMGLNKWLN